MEYKINPRFGCEVYVSAEGDICVSQDRTGETETLVFAPDEVLDLIELLKKVHQETIDLYSEECGVEESE